MVMNLDKDKKEQLKALYQLYKVGSIGMADFIECLDDMNIDTHTKQIIIFGLVHCITK
jgi:hypothetical protein